MVIAGVLVVAALVHISRSISAPLLHLADRMRRLAANDTDIDIRETERRDEIGEMAQAAVVFRNNAIELMRSQRMLARQAAMLEERLAQEQRLALLQRNFVSMASHEFRTPLTIIDGHARRLVKTKDSVTADEIGERAGKVRAAVLRMTHLIDNLLNSSRLIDGGAAPYFHPAEMDMAALLHEVCQVHREMAPGAQITERLAPRRCRWSATPSSCSRCSAISSPTPSSIRRGGAIEVAAEITAGDAVVTISDRGIGIPAADLDRLFERYHRGSNVSGIVGTGVGLYLVKMAVELHGGRVEVDSNEGDGARFTIRLPLRPAPGTNVWPPVRAQAAVAAAEEGPPIVVPAESAPSVLPGVEQGKS